MKRRVTLQQWGEYSRCVGFEVLGLADAPRTRHELKERADVSRITICRLLDDLEERDWIVHENGAVRGDRAGPNGFFRIADGEVVEDWSLWDAVTLMGQLGTARDGPP